MISVKEGEAMEALHDACQELWEEHGWSLDDVLREVEAIAPRD